MSSRQLGYGIEFKRISIDSIKSSFDFSSLCPYVNCLSIFFGSILFLVSIKSSRRISKVRKSSL